ncbi:MAG: hypothetical protein VXZ53_10310, partial [Planctomycetota bacterium]|nr:hypothetical protein [Planctomycetota bacterium]
QRMDHSPMLHVHHGQNTFQPFIRHFQAIPKQSDHRRASRSPDFDGMAITRQGSKKDTRQTVPRSTHAKPKRNTGKHERRAGWGIV